MSGLRQVVLALLTLSNEGCRSLRRHGVAAERPEWGGRRRGDGKGVKEEVVREERKKREAIKKNWLAKEEMYSV